MYRVQVLLLYRVIRLPYCQFFESGKLAEILGTVEDTTEEFDQHFETNTIEPRGTLLQVPTSYIIEAVDDNSTPNSNETITSIPDNPVTDCNDDDILKALMLLELGTNATLPQLSKEDELRASYEHSQLSLLELPIDKLLQRGLRLRTKTTKARANYTLAAMPIVSVKAFTAAVTSEELGIIIPKSFKELQQLLEAKEWLAAAYIKIRMHNRIKTQRKEGRPSNYKVLRGRWVFTAKRGPNSKFSRFKARQVVRGFIQREGIDYDDTYVAVAKLVLLRVLFAMLAEEDLECY